MAQMSQNGRLQPFLRELEDDRELDDETKVTVAELARTRLPARGRGLRPPHPRAALSRPSRRRAACAPPHASAAGARRRPSRRTACSRAADRPRSRTPAGRRPRSAGIWPASCAAATSSRRCADPLVGDLDDAVLHRAGLRPELDPGRGEEAAAGKHAPLEVVEERVDQRAELRRAGRRSRASGRCTSALKICERRLDRRELQLLLRAEVGVEAALRDADVRRRPPIVIPSSPSIVARLARSAGSSPCSARRPSAVSGPPSPWT